MKEGMLSRREFLGTSAQALLGASVTVALGARSVGAQGTADSACASTDTIRTQERDTMRSSYILQHGMFQHLVLEGTAYEVGRAQAAYIQGTPGMERALAKADVDPKTYGFASFAELQQQYTRLCPGICEELEGFAAGLGVHPDRLAFYAESYWVPSQCAHMIALPTITSNRHVYVGRSYELNYTQADLRLCTTRVAGKLAHIGFSGALFGRWDGMNSTGLTVTSSAGTSAGLPHEWVKVRGFTSWLALRAILESCRNVDEALEVLQGAPVDYVNIMIADSAGKAALVEVAGTKRAVKRVDPGASEGYLISANHYTLPEMVQYNTNATVIGHSMPRYAAMGTCIREDRPMVGAETFRRVLMREFPDGCFCPYYAQWLGTVWAMIFDVTDRQVEICFGSPGYNDWHTFDLGGAPGITRYEATFAQKE